MDESFNDIEKDGEAGELHCSTWDIKTYVHIIAIKMHMYSLLNTLAHTCMHL